LGQRFTAEKELESGSNTSVSRQVDSGGFEGNGIWRFQGKKRKPLDPPGADHRLARTRTPQGDQNEKQDDGGGQNKYLARQQFVEDRQDLALHKTSVVTPDLYHILLQKQYHLFISLKLRRLFYEES
jgi:hypothetical protein